MSVTGGGVGVDKVRKQKKLEAGKMFTNGDKSPPSSAPGNDGGRSFSTKENVQQKYTPNQQVYKPYKAVEMCLCGTPVMHPFDRLRTDLVSGPDDPSIGGGRSSAMTPLRKLIT